MPSEHGGGGHGSHGVASGVRRRPIDVTRKLPLVRSQTKELVLDDSSKVEGEAEEDTLNTTELQAKLKDIPVPVSQPQERCRGAAVFELPAEYLRRAPPLIPSSERVDWDIDPAGYAFLLELNAGKKGYSGPAIEEAVFEQIIDAFEKSVVQDKLPDLATLETKLAPLVPDVSVIKPSFGWWVDRRKFSRCRSCACCARRPTRTTPTPPGWPSGRARRRGGCGCAATTRRRSR